MSTYTDGGILNDRAISPTAMAVHRRALYRWLLLLALPVGFILTFYIYPLTRMLLMSLFDPDFTMKHYNHFFREPAYFLVLIETFKMAASVTVITFLLGYPVAYLLANAPPRTSRLLMIIVVLPFLTAILVRSYAWMVILGRNGVLNQLLLQLNLISSPVKLIHNIIGVYIGMVQILLPFMILPLYSVMSGINKDYLKAAENLGASPVKVFLYVFFPLSLPGVGGGCLLVFIIGLGFYITPSLLGGVSDVMISMLIESQVNSLLNWGFASALAVVLLVVTLILFYFYNRFFGVDRLVGGH
jgi:ABC-type spermidine/putrescine transport system permease subunit I